MILKLLKLHCVISAQEFYKLKVYKRLDNKLFGCAMINNNCALEINILLFDSKRCCTLQNKQFVFNPFAPGDFAEKHVLKLVEWFSGHCRAIKS